MSKNRKELEKELIDRELAFEMEEEKKLDNYDSFVDENTLSVNVNRLRKKLDAAGLEGFIATQHGVGYMLK